MEKQKNNKGITLISLIITIIVLLVILTITIQTLVGETGTVEKAEQAKENYSIIEEIDILKTCAAMSMGYSTRAKVEYYYFREYCNQNIGTENKDYSIEVEASGKYFYVTFLGSGNVYTVRDDGEIKSGKETF